MNLPILAVVGAVRLSGGTGELRRLIGGCETRCTDMGILAMLGVVPVRDRRLRLTLDRLRRKDIWLSTVTRCCSMCGGWRGRIRKMVLIW